MPTIADLCKAAQTDRSTVNNARNAGYLDSFGDLQSEGFAIRLGFFAAFRAIGFHPEVAADYANSLASAKNLKALGAWYPNEKEFHLLSAGAKQWKVGSLLGLTDDGTGEWVSDDEPVRPTLVRPPSAVVVIDLHGIRDRMLALFR